MLDNITCINYFSSSSNMYFYRFVYTFATLSFILQHKNVQGGNKFSIAQIIKIMFNNKGILQNITVPHLDFDTGEQEFGCFKGYFENVNINGLDAYEVTKFNISIKQLQVNLLVPQLNFTGYYNLDGMLNFPMGNRPIHIFGKGDMKIIIENLTTSVKLTLKSQGGVIKVDKLLISVNITSTNMKLCNLMGGGALEDIFNEYLSLLGATVFDYYKNNVIEQMKDPLIREIDKFLDSFFSIETGCS